MAPMDKLRVAEIWDLVHKERMRLAADLEFLADDG